MKNKKVVYPKLPKVLKRKWIAALRSGDYKQTIGTLVEQDGNNGYKYCCLGVACKVAWSKPLLSDILGQGTIPARVEITPILKKGEAMDRLIDLNDTKKWSFKKIATWIEKNL